MVGVQGWLLVVWVGNRVPLPQGPEKKSFGSGLGLLATGWWLVTSVGYRVVWSNNGGWSHG